MWLEETWQSSLLYVLVCYFGGWSSTKPGKIQKVVMCAHTTNQQKHCDNEIQALRLHFLWSDLDQDQWPTICFDHGASKKLMNPWPEWIHRFLWFTIIQTDLGSLIVIQINPKETHPKSMNRKEKRAGSRAFQPKSWPVCLLVWYLLALARYTNRSDHFTVVCSITWPLNAVRLQVTLFLSRPHCFCCVNQVALMLNSLHFNQKK